MPLTDPTGTPLVTLPTRRDEVIRCMRVIGWSLSRLGDLLHVSPGAMAQLNRCKTEFNDSDIAWLQRVALAVAALPRPEVVRRFPEAGLEVSMAPTLVDTDTVEDEGVDDMEAVSAQIAEVYFVARVDPELTEGQREGAAWALSELMERLGVTEACRARVAQMQRVRVFGNEGRLLADVQRPSFADEDAAS